MKSSISGAFGSLVLALTACASIAQETAPAGAPDRARTAACELHVWPADAVRSTYSGWFHGGIVDGAVQGRDGYRKLPDSILSPEAQLRTLGEMDLPAMLQLAGYRVVLHDQPLPSRVIRAAKGRLLADTPPCYAELVTDDVFFQQDIIDGRFIKAIFRFRQFDSSDVPARSFGTYTQYRLTQFPPEEPEQLDAALEEFRQAFGHTIEQFCAAVNRPVKGKKAKPKP